LESVGTHAFIYLTVYRNFEFLSETKELTSCIMLTETSDLYNLYNRPMCHVASKAFFDIYEYHSLI
jgi:hypothetical protein